MLVYLKPIRSHVATLVVFALLSVSPANADNLDPSYLSKTGHYYALVGPFTFDPPVGPGYPGISWGTANDDAETRYFKHVQGHLATINLAEENAFVEQMLATRPDCFSIEFVAGSYRFQLGPWIGGMRPDNTSDFEWVNNEGPFADASGLSIGDSFVDFINPPEPNGQNFVNYIDFLERPDGAELGWSDCNDYSCFRRRSPVCYVVEFDTPREPSRVPVTPLWALLFGTVGLLAVGMRASAVKHS